VRILTDPGNYNDTPDVEDIDAILISHEHPDHCHVDSLKEILARNPQARIVTHAGVGKILDEQDIAYTLISDTEEIVVKDVTVQSFGTEHACIHHDLPVVQNTGFFINKFLFYPGDSFHNPHQDIAVLALPVSGPWMKIEEAVEYAKAVKPKVVFPVHDGMLRQDHRLGPTRRVPQTLLEPLGIKYVDMLEGSVEDFATV
jgi:L-ascorbate metabolism protein UlaG (beta-lactamase superfamily)